MHHVALLTYKDEAGAPLAEMSKHVLHTFDEKLLKLDGSRLVEGLAIRRPGP